MKVDDYIAGVVVDLETVLRSDDPNRIGRIVGKALAAYRDDVRRLTLAIWDSHAIEHDPSDCYVCGVYIDVTGGRDQPS